MCDGPTDRQTDIVTYRVALHATKKRNEIEELKKVELCNSIF